MIRISVFLFLCLGIFSCSSKQEDIQRIQTLEQKMADVFLAGNTSGAEKLAGELHGLYLSFIAEHEDDTLRPYYIYQVAMVEAEPFKRFDESVARFDQLLREYPHHRLASKAQFLKGYTYAEYLNDKISAAQAYKTYLQKYPDGPMASSVRFELENIDKPTPELILENEQ